jgi:ATP-binding cassette subfamily B (MDR/TAP) protein 1
MIRYLSISQEIHLFKDMCPITQIERDMMEKIPYASTIGSIMYAMLCIRLDEFYALSITNRYESNSY